MTDSAQRVAVVTGAAGAPGGAVLDEFPGSGWTVVALDRPGSRLENLGARPDVHPVPVDLADRAAVGAAFGRVDVVGAPAGLIALAGGFRPSSLGDVTEDGLDEKWRSNVVGLLWCVQHAAPRMAAAGGGAVVTVGSRTALTGSAPIAYATSKAAVVRLPSCWPRSCGRRGSGSTAFD
ncbi:MAG: SDR family oxidoreductase [Actinomycetota bacterium]|nr:SDR family oxidoreductase [Actinomycetota bacterium]